MNTNQDSPEANVAGDPFAATRLLGAGASAETATNALSLVALAGELKVILSNLQRAIRTHFPEAFRAETDECERYREERAASRQAHYKKMEAMAMLEMLRNREANRPLTESEMSAKAAANARNLGVSIEDETPEFLECLVDNLVLGGYNRDEATRAVEINRTTRARDWGQFVGLILPQAASLQTATNGSLERMVNRLSEALQHGFQEAGYQIKCEVKEDNAIRITAPRLSFFLQFTDGEIINEPRIALFMFKVDQCGKLIHGDSVPWRGLEYETRRFR